MPLVPEYQAMLEALAAEPGPSIPEMSPEEARALYRMMRPLNADLTVGEVIERSVPGPAGEVPLRIYRPQAPGPHPLLAYFHGGGWVIGDLDTADAACRDLCETAGCVVASVDYRLAPEHRFPAAVDDCYAALEWLSGHAEELGGNGRLAVAGESAGGNLAAVLCLKARDEAGPKIDFQLLLYPVADHDLSRPSYVDNGAGYILETPTMRWFWEHYCPDPAGRSHPHASPLRATDHGELPPALVMTAEFDPLRDEGNFYAETLAAAGTQVEAICYDGLVHDFFATAQQFKASRAPFKAACAALRKALR
ncbi:MAG: alpha/beta hydrolase [Gammaproteobacteria bacterium]|nr:alpha/beta hydrolase [Gammaproteobacteria bacterium]